MVGSGVARLVDGDPDDAVAGVVDPADLAAKSGLVDVINSIPGSEHLATLANAVGKAANERMLDQLGIYVETAPRWGEIGGVPAVGQTIDGGKADKAKSEG